MHRRCPYRWWKLWLYLISCYIIYHSQLIIQMYIQHIFPLFLHLSPMVLNNRLLQLFVIKICQSIWQKLLSSFGSTLLANFIFCLKLVSIIVNDWVGYTVFFWGGLSMYFLFLLLFVGFSFCAGNYGIDHGPYVLGGGYITLATIGNSKVG